MSSDERSNKNGDDQSFPVQLIILLAVIVAGVLLFILKSAGIF